MSIRIKHTSDNHGKMPNLNGKYDIWVSTGDFFPDFKAPKNEWAELQKEWLQGFAEELASIPSMKEKIFLFCDGNHDFCPPEATEQILRAAGINAYNTHDKIVTVKDTNFYGFPWLPPINGSFNYETEKPEMIKKIDAMVEVINNNVVDVVLMHAPPYDILDTYKQMGQDVHGGNTFINHAIEYKIEKGRLPQAFCFGHIHSKDGVKIVYDTLMINSACSSTIFEL